MAGTTVYYSPANTGQSHMTNFDHQSGANGAFEIPFVGYPPTKKGVFTLQVGGGFPNAIALPANIVRNVKPAVGYGL
jgi:hypothetical protein